MNDILTKLLDLGKKLGGQLVEIIPFELELRSVVFGIVVLVIALSIFIFLRARKKSSGSSGQTPNKKSGVAGSSTSPGVFASDSQLASLDQRITFLEQFKETTFLQTKKLVEVAKNIKNTETVRYNPFADAGVGGLQSFSTAFLDQKGNGIILTSLYSREKNRVMIKEISGWKSEQELSPEEIEVMGNIKQRYN